MYYERINGAWKQNNKKSALFNGDTIPIDIVPAEFWNADRMPAAPVPEYDANTYKLTGPQEIDGGFVGYVAVELTLGELEANYQKTVPKSISRKQGLIMLKREGLLDTVKQVVAAKDAEDGESQLAFDEASTFDRTDPLLVYVADMCDKDESFLDQFFIDGSNL